MSKWRTFFRFIFIMIFIVSANSFYFMRTNLWLAPIAAIGFFLVNFAAGFTDTTMKKFRLMLLSHGVECLRIFYVSMIVSIGWHIYIICAFPWKWYPYLVSVIWCVIAHAILFWNGIISVYCTSVQLGIKQRIIGAICGPIPIAHLFALKNIIKITKKEVATESQKDMVNRQRAHLQICKTKYPILLVHGVFFRDSKKLNYWGRIPKELEKNGATVFYGEHQSALSVEKSAGEIAERILEIIRVTNCEKVNIIAHSKGGLDCKYAIANLGIAPFVASLTTINTPHRGCGFADYLLEKIPQNMQMQVADTYNKAAIKLGDTTPDFMEAVYDLRAAACEENDKRYIMPKDIYCQSYGSILAKATHGKFPLNFSYPLVKHFDGLNDGLVAMDSFSFGERFIIVSNNGGRGISHADMIDLNRENIPGFDVREFYVQLVYELQMKGL